MSRSELCPGRRVVPDGALAARRTCPGLLDSGLDRLGVVDGHDQSSKSLVPQSDHQTPFGDRHRYVVLQSVVTEGAHAQVGHADSGAPALDRIDGVVDNLDAHHVADRHIHGPE